MYMIGPKYIADIGIHWLRRTVWLFLVLMSFAFVVYQIQDRIRTYLSYPSNTQVSITYPKRLSFPQVTICNLNANSMYIGKCDPNLPFSWKMV